MAPRFSFTLRPFFAGAIALAISAGTIVGSSASSAAGDPRLYNVGVAKVDITPAYPIRLNGFGGRRDESAGITQPIWAKALAIDSGEGASPLVLITLDSLGIREPMVDEVARRLAAKAGVARDHVVVTFSHSHTTPKVVGACDTIFSSPIPPEHQAHIDRYTAELTDAMERSALEALADRKPATLEWAVGSVGFAMNRRTPGGPVDHDLPVLVVKSPAGAIRAIYVTYACHCVTLSDNKISGDWSGFAQDAMQRNHDGAIALVSIGCGSDSNPNSGVTGANTAAAAEQGAQIADEVERLLHGALTPVDGPLSVTLAHIDLPLNPPPSRAALEKLAAQEDAAGYNAKFQLARLERGESLLTKLDYPVQTATFGDSLAMVFLAGEVCVDYSLRLKQELDAKRLWMHGYSNDFCAYIPSERLLKEGGYGGGAEVVYFALPNTLAPGLEQKIIAEVHRQVPQPFKRPGQFRQSMSEPLPMGEAVASIQPRPGFVVELMAAEPLVADPVAIDFGPDGRMWVADMTDYEHEVGDEFEQTSAVRVLTDRDGDGRYDDSQVFAGGLRFPTDVKVWRNGVIVCDAPDVLYFEDADGDGQAEVRKTLITGFETHNPQARVNSLRWGLDNWLYGAGGIFGGNLTTFSGVKVQLGGRDFRFKPDTGEIEAVTGRTQQGRDRVDWGNWFGCDNGTLVKHFPLVDHYLARNPHVLPPDTELFVPQAEEGQDPSELYPVSQPMLFKLSGPPGRPTAACGLGVYRDELLGPEFNGNAFTAEPANNLVHRRVVSPSGIAFSGLRAKGESEAEFLAAIDAWFRPVQIRTGPDGCLWVVDMHRAVIEHKIWIPEEELGEIDIWGGRQQGRIYRIRPEATPARPIVQLDQLDAAGLAAAIDSPNGPQRDMAHQLLVQRGGAGAAPHLKKLVGAAERPVVRLQALCALDGLEQLDAPTLLAALADKHPAVRRHAVRLSEVFFAKSPEVVDAVLKLVDDSDPQVQVQLAYSLGAVDDPRAAEALGRLAWSNRYDPYLQAAVWSSATAKNVGPLVRDVFRRADIAELPPGLLNSVVKMTLKLGDVSCLQDLAAALAVVDDSGQAAPWRLEAAALILEQLREKPSESADAQAIRRQLAPLAAAARATIEAGGAPEGLQLAAVRVLAASGAAQSVAPVLADLLGPQSSPAIQQAVVKVMATVEGPAASEALLAAWNGFSPATRARAFDVMLGREDLILALLDAVANGRVRAADLDAFQRERLLTHRNEAISARAAAALAGAIDVNREKIVQQYLVDQTREADAEHGREVFGRVCSSCHRLDGVGFSVGPDLAALTSRTRQAFTESILDPNRAVDERYQTYAALTADGLAHCGILQEETSTSVTLVEQQGKAHTLLRAELETLENTGRSLMPEGLEKDLSPADLTDLVAYLTAQQPLPKSLPGNSPQTVTADYDGSLWLLAANARIYGGDVTYETPFKNIGYWHGSHDYIQWAVETPRAGEYDAFIHLASPPDAAGNKAVLEGCNPSLNLVVPSTGGYDRYQVVHLGRTRLAEGDNRLTLRPDGPLATQALMDLRGVYLAPVGVSAERAEAGDAPAGASDAATRIAKLLDGLAVGADAEYDRIPAIWEQAIAAGKRNSENELVRVLDLSLPKGKDGLADWQAVVIGGGLVNGVSQAGLWPKQRFAEILEGKPALAQRWERTLQLASAMADDPAVRTGTRYDALRIVGVDDFDRRGEQLLRYLGSHVHEELQMGAVSALADVDSPQAAAMLIDNYQHLHKENRNLAIEGLLRDARGAVALRDAIDAGKVPPRDLDEQQRSKLQHMTSSP
ncbi:MAG: neutral/alkaline non-lysosomal ceramidase N-terminal domain-containing protein [Pirellulales bacterium]|nr:neutral/alkaline non-lysosomal ceramidase N-terminal domain-containing protein [Pirellulales bacterium]